MFLELHHTFSHHQNDNKQTKQIQEHQHQSAHTQNRTEQKPFTQTKQTCTSKKEINLTSLTRGVWHDFHCTRTLHHKDLKCTTCRYCHCSYWQCLLGLHLLICVFVLSLHTRIPHVRAHTHARTHAHTHTHTHKDYRL